MKFEKLILPPVSLAALYRRSLIEDLNQGSSATSPKKDEETASYSYYGKNRGHVCLLVNVTGKEIIPQIYFQFISRMLEACKMSPDDVAILNHGHHLIEIKKLKQQLKPDRIVLFGISPGDIGLPVNFPMFKPQVYDSTTYIFAPALDQLTQENEAGRLLKSKLWVCLRQVFQV